MAHDQRRSKRFELRLPFELVEASTGEIKKIGETRNVSSVGVLFTSTKHLEIGDPIEYCIALHQGPNGKKLVRLRCVGKVVRRHRGKRAEESGQTVVLAATLERYRFVRTKK